MELTKNDIKMTKGLAIIFMVLLHLFCRKTNLLYEPILSFGETHLIYYIGLFGDCCVVMYCFCSGYAHCLINEKRDKPYAAILKRLPSFLIQFWLVCILFSIVGLIIQDPGIPGSLHKFMGNIFLYNLSYNGAWWFVITYILLCLISPLIMYINKKHPFVSLVIFFAIYFISYLVRFNKIPLLSDNIYFIHLSGTLAPFGTSLFPYVIGAYFYKYRIFSRISCIANYLKKPVKNTVLIIFMLALFIFHAFIESLFVAIITGIGTIVCFNLWDKKKVATALFSFMGQHSTNIWLTHMFFYLVLFKNLVFIAKFPIFCFLFMMILTILSSLVINFILKIIFTKTPLKKLKV